MRKRMVCAPWAASLLLAACQGDVIAPAAPLRDLPLSGDGGVGGSLAGADGGAGLVGGEAPSNLGVQIFASCSDGKELPGPRLLRLLTRSEYASTVADLLHVQAPDVASLPLESRVRGYDNNAGSQAVTSRHVDAYVALAQELAEKAVNEQRGALLHCNEGDATCPRSFVTEFGLRAFRRPLTEDELTRYTAFFASDVSGGAFTTGLALTVQAMLVSPAFLYRSEAGEPTGSGTYTLSPYEVASSLSYLYWGTMPDDTLLAAARDGRLGSAEDRTREAKRLLADPRAEAQLFLFSAQWLRSDGLLSANKDKQIYPNFSDSVREAMLQEQRRFLTKVVLADKGSVEDLYDADYVIANGELASFYGLSGGSQDFAVVPAGESGRGGLLGLGAVLAAHAHSNESSPVKRGLFVRDRLLCQSLPPPPQNLDITPPGLDPTLTTRARFAKHTASPSCSSCHRFIDGVGFGFEGFDGVGQRRTIENGLPVDESGALVGLESLSSDESTDFAGPRELAQLIAKSDSAGACLALQFFRYGRGYEERASDACALATLKKNFDAEGESVYALLVGLAELDSFVTRRDP